MPKAIIANFSPHQIGTNAANVAAFNDRFGEGNWEVVGSIPVIPDIGNHRVVTAIVQLWCIFVLQKQPTHIHINANSAFNGLIYQMVEAFPELRVPRIIWDARRRQWWLAPPPMSRQDRMDIETRSIKIPAELSEWVLSLGVA